MISHQLLHAERSSAIVPLLLDQLALMLVAKGVTTDLT
jgi:hypothetical protein